MSRYVYAILGLLLFFSGVAFCTAAKPLMTPEKMLIVDGKPSFVLGLYENPQDDAALLEAAKAGFNLVHASANKASLDRLQKFGVKAWINLGGNLNLSDNSKENRQRLLDMVNKYKDHPALLAWEGPDEALWISWCSPVIYMTDTEYPMLKKAIEEAGDDPELKKMLIKYEDLVRRGVWDRFEVKRAEIWQRLGKTPERPDTKLTSIEANARKLGEGLGRGIDLVHKADPDHVVWLNHAPRNSIKSLRFFGKKADMIGCDIYPVPEEHYQGHSDLESIRRSSVGAYTKRMRKASPNKAYAMVLQGFGWRDIMPELDTGSIDNGIGRRPNIHETRFMAFDAIVHGANAIMYFGTYYIEKDSQLWKNIMIVAREIRTLEPALVAPPVKPAPKVSIAESLGSVDGKGVFTTLRKVGRDYVLIVVNENTCGSPFTIKKLPAELNGRTLYLLGTDESLTVKRRAFSDGIRERNVNIYATSRRFEVVKDR